MTQHYGATPEEWDQFSLILGLTNDLLPVVSNPTATISPESKMKGIGKTPSRYNSKGYVVGFAKWTEHVSVNSEIQRWRDNPDYGICIQTREVRVLDCDIDNTILAKDIYDSIARFLDTQLPTRRRGGAPRFVLAFTLAGEFSKRTIPTDGGVIEFLATGQQFIAAGQHPNGERYTWDGGLPDDIPALSAEQFEGLWQHLIEAFANAEATQTKPSTKKETLKEATSNDPVAISLFNRGAVLSSERDGRLHIICPFAGEHTNDTGDSSTTYFPAHTGGYQRGHFKCLHAHCAGRLDSEFLAALDIADPSIEDFDIIPITGANEPNSGKANKYVLETFDQFHLAEPPRYIIDGVLPRAPLAVIYGESTSGKTFVAIDFAIAIAGGRVWRDRAVEQGRVVYIAAEDANGVRLRFMGAQRHFDLPAGIPVGMLADAPNFTKGEDVAEVLKAIRAGGGADVIFVDTFAQVTAGSNENSGEDMGTALGYCRVLHKHTGATVVLIHHSGKDTTKGARGHSSLRAAADCEIEVTRSNEDREIEIRKLKNDADGARFGFKLVPVLTGRTNRHGEDVVTCVVEHTTTSRVKLVPLRSEHGKQIKQHYLDEVEATGENEVMEANIKDRFVKAREAAGDAKPRQGWSRGLKAVVDSGFLLAINGKLIGHNDGKALT